MNTEQKTRETLTMRRTFEKVRRAVLHLRAEDVVAPEVEEANTSEEASEEM